MMRTGTIAFLASAALLVPAGFRPLGAGSPEDPAASRPPAEILAVKDANVEVSLDRRAVAAGESVHVRLVASAQTRQDVEVVVALLEQRGSQEERVIPAPVVIESESVRVAAAPGGGPAHELTFRLRGEVPPKGADPIAFAGRSTQYTVLVQSAFDAKVGSQRAKAMEDMGIPEGAVALPVLAERPSAYALAVEVPPGLVAGQAFEATVVVKNTSKKTLQGISVNLAPMAGEGGPGLVEEYADEADVTIEVVGEESIEALRPGQSQAIRFKVQPGADTRATYLRAFTWADYGGPARAERTVRLGTIEGPTAVAKAR